VDDSHLVYSKSKIRVVQILTDVYCYTVSLTTLALPVSRNTIIQDLTRLKTGTQEYICQWSRIFILQQFGMNSTLTLALTDA
jgi:hypothetical protein